MRWKEKPDTRYDCWKRWFAWRPVFLEHTKEWVWWETIERKKTVEWSYDGPDVLVEYRSPNSDLQINKEAFLRT